MRNRVQTVDRALRILESFEVDGQGRSVSEIAAGLGVHRSTASRIAATLAARGFLERVPDSESFQLGPQLGRLGILALAGRGLIEAARKPMERLAAETGETVTLAVRRGDEAATIAQIDARFVVGVKNWIGGRTPLHCTSDGKVLLAFGEEQVLPAELARLTTRTITEPGELRRELEGIRERGWATAVGEYEDGLHGVGAPIFDPSGRSCAALSVSGPYYRVSSEALPVLGRRCGIAAQEIGSQLVWGAKRRGEGSEEWRSSTTTI
jgi:DNA-binding IclR family transcriptional regulator